MDYVKTNVMRILEKEKIPYREYSYDAGDGQIDGVSVAAKMGIAVEKVYKTLVTQGHSRNYFVFVIPAACELDLKAAARAVGEKSVEMIKVADINKITGYIRGGCSPVGMKKQFTTVIDSSCEALNTIIVSAGKIGYQIEISPKALAGLIGCKFEKVVVHG